MKKLERRLSLPYVIAIAIGGMLGSGLFVLPGLAAAKTGSSIWLAYVLAGFCVLPAALSKSELATAMPTSGGTYVFIERTFGPMWGTISGFGLWLSLLLKSSFALVGFGAYLLVFWDVPLKPASLTLLAFITVLNLGGVKKVGKVQMVIVSVSVFSLLMLFIWGMFQLNPVHIKPVFTDGTTGFIAATGFVFISYAGVTKVAAIAGEIKDPGRNLPIAMLSALGLIGLIYGSITFVLTNHVSQEVLETDLHPIYTLAKILGGPTIGIIAAVIGVLTLFSMANSGVLAASRFPFAMSRDQLLPAFLQKVHPKFLTPIVTIALTGLVMALVIIFLDVEKIAKLASAFMVMMFIAVNLSVIVLRETGVQWYKPVYQSPMYPWIQIFGVFSGLILLVFLGGLALMGAIVITIFGGLVYQFYGRSRASRKGVLNQYGHFPALFLLYRKGKRRLIKQKKGTEEDLSKFEEIIEDMTIDNNLDGSLSKNSAIVVPLFGQERSPETLVEVGAALADGKKIQVVHLTEVPEQTILEALLEEDVMITSLNRRISAMAVERFIDVEFDAAVTHEMVQTIAEISNQTHCKWLVMGWDGRTSTGLLVRNPIGWLVTNISCNMALFKDKGVRYIHKILVHLVAPQHDPWLVAAAIDLAKFYNANLTFVRVVPENFSEEETTALRNYMASLNQSSQAKAELLILSNKNSRKAIIKSTAAYDLLIIGSPSKESLINVLLGRGKDSLSEDAACSVLKILKPNTSLFTSKDME